MGSIVFHIVCQMIATDNPGSGGINGGSNKQMDAMTLTAWELTIAVVSARVFPSIP